VARRGKGTQSGNRGAAAAACEVIGCWLEYSNVPLRLSGASVSCHDFFAAC
jgi:hypothetical protein